MEFKKSPKIVTAVLVLVGVIGLVVRLAEGQIKTGKMIAPTEDFGRIEITRAFLIGWESFWLTSIAVLFILIAKTASTEKTEEMAEKIELKEPLLFKVAITFLAIAAIATLLVPAFVGPGLPHYRTARDADATVIVEARQFEFSLNGTACTSSDKIEDACMTLKTGVNYAFELTTVDTTHGFGIYDDHNVLIIQAQIVPGYTTRLLSEFDTPGLYHFRCLEYCGAGHRDMVATVIVEG